MRSRRYLLLTTALGSGALIGACRKEPAVSDHPPLGNSKGSFYDAGQYEEPNQEPRTGEQPESESPADGGAPTTIGVSSNEAGVDTHTGPIRPRLPANPKGSLYDAGNKPTPPKP